MKKHLIVSLRITVIMIILLAVIYPLLISFAARFSPGNGGGEKIYMNGRVVGYTLIGQSFTDDKYFNGRPSAVEYNAAGSGGSNKGPSNPDYLKVVSDRIDSFLVHNPGVQTGEIPAELITASGSGLDPHLSPAAAAIQVKRIATVRNIPEDKISFLITKHTEKPWLGPAFVHVLKLNIDLDQLR